ncbi:Hypothetical protein D9617_10g073260 [Elsinoe fawcettii]|nr:Hypothetical protein D9617_10g073260 [Elsinoe fawcettii]
MHLPLALPLLASTVLAAHHTPKPRTVITTDMESDDLASLVRYILYSNDIQNLGLVYTSSKFHWEGDGRGTPFFLPGREYNTSQTSWRPTGTTTIEDQLLRAYGEVYRNLKVHDEAYPSPEELRGLVRVGNVEFEGEMEKDTPGSELIRELLLDGSQEMLYLQAWGGTNTIARALRSVQEEYDGTEQWEEVRERIVRKTVILASGFQDDTYAEYIAPTWPEIRVEERSKAYATWGFNCNNTGLGNVRGLPDNNVYYHGEWIKANIQTGPLGSLYRSWLDGQTTFGGGDQLDVFGDPVKAPFGWCKPMEKYDFLSEGDNVAFNSLLSTGLQNPSDPTTGGWGGRAKQNSTSPDLWVLVDTEKAANGSEVENWTTDRWVAAAQNDFAARMQWTLTSEYNEGNHAPSVSIDGPARTRVRAGESVRLSSRVSDPDDNTVSVTWWQYLEESTYPGTVNITTEDNGCASVDVGDDARPGQTVSIILQGTDDGEFPLTRYDRAILVVV